MQIISLRLDWMCIKIKTRAKEHFFFLILLIEAYFMSRMRSSKGELML